MEAASLPASDGVGVLVIFDGAGVRGDTTTKSAAAVSRAALVRDDLLDLPPRLEEEACLLLFLLEFPCGTPPASLPEPVRSPGDRRGFRSGSGDEKDPPVI